MQDDLALRGAQYVGRRIEETIAEVGRIALLVAEMFRWLVPAFGSARLILQQMHAIGVASLGLVAVVSVFTGAVAAVQAAYQFTAVVPLKFLGAVILRSVIIELGPVLTALVLSGRVGASIAAELGTMKVTEQIDALKAMAINPVRYLVVPRVVAAVVMLPIITIYADAIAIFGGWVVATTSLGVNTHIYVQGLQEFFLVKDLAAGLLKSLIFGGIIATMGCHYGFSTEGGAEGVGKATTHAVVASCVQVLISDYVLAHVLFRFVFGS
jgi:phospholipid/cholesterol/gamma-HCH transport system permease protein